MKSTSPEFAGSAPACTNPAFELREPVTLVTTAGAECFGSSWHLMRALDGCDGYTARILAFMRGSSHATARSVEALNCYLRTLGPGLRHFKSRSKSPWFSRYGWAELQALLGLEYEPSNVVVARLAPGPYFGPPARPALLVANFDGNFAALT